MLGLLSTDTGVPDIFSAVDFWAMAVSEIAVVPFSLLNGFNDVKDVNENEENKSGLSQTSAVATARIITIINNIRFNLLKILISFH